MKTIVTFSFAVCVAVSLVHATPFNLKRSVGPLDGKCHGIGSADSKNIKSSEKDNHPQWLNTYLNDPEIICGYLLADQSHTDPFQLQGYYSAGPEGHYVPALYELRYYPDATAPVAGQPNIPVEDGTFILTLDDKAYNIPAFPPTDSSIKRVLSSKNGTFTLAWSEPKVAGTSWFLKRVPPEVSQQTLTPPPGGPRPGNQDDCPYVIDPTPNYWGPRACPCHVGDGGCNAKLNLDGQVQGPKPDDGR